jgi:polyisoprenoid-binding protein YceI
MKKIITSIFVLSLLFVSCKEKAKEEKVSNAETTTEKIASAIYNVNSETSTLNWKGFKPTGTHNGTVTLKEGSFEVKEDKLVSGKFVFDMNTITVLDIPAEEEGNAKLTGHLKSGDFFDVENNEFATFQISGESSNTLIKGDLTIKGITKSIEFPVTMSSTEEGIKLTGATFQIDRTDFDIQYKSTKFFDNLKDKFINDEFEISFEINANK